LLRVSCTPYPLEEFPVPQKTVTVGSKVGLHARPAALFVKAVAASGLPVTLSKSGGTPVSAASILSVLTLNVAFGDEVTLETEGSNADQVLGDLARMLESELDA
jgi:phosphocarrier protein HPr